MAYQFKDIDYLNNPIYKFDPNLNLDIKSIFGSGSDPESGPDNSVNYAKPSSKSMFQIKEKLLRPATTSHFQAWFGPPVDVQNWIKSENRQINYPQISELISLSCSEASLPGNSLNTNEINDDRTGVTERFAYRKVYDDRADFTFYVDHNDLNSNNYNVIWLFENWIAYIAKEEYSRGFESPNYNYRFRFPNGKGGSGQGYRSDIVLNKFEKDYRGGYLEYKFLEAYPISINSMPVSYDSSQLLKCTVSFTYTRYTIKRQTSPNKPILGNQVGNTELQNLPNYSDKAFGGKTKQPSTGFDKNLTPNLEPYMTDLRGIGRKELVGDFYDSTNRPAVSSPAFGGPTSEGVA